MTRCAPLLSACGRFVALFLFGVALGSLLPRASAESATSSGNSASPAGAPVSPGEQRPPARYEQAIDLAFKEFELANYAEARARFLEAHKLFSNARTFRALGMVEYELKNYGDAIQSLQQALDCKVRPLDPDARSATQELMERAKGYIARINLDVNPGMASVVLDGMPVQIAPGGTLVLQVGDHTLEFRAPGRLPEKRQLKITGGEEKTLQVVLPPAVDMTAAPQKAARPLRKNPWLWTAVGAVVIGAAVGLGVGLRGTEHSTAEPKGGDTGVVLAGPR